MKKKYNWLNHLFNFLAVILGVYLAFYINERAKASEERKESLILMNSLISDLSSDVEIYERYQIPINIEHQENVDSLLSLLTTNKIEDINSQLPTIFEVENYFPTSSTYNSMKASGKIRLLEDLSLQKKLSDYYDGLVVECVKKGEIQADYFMNELISWLTINADLMEMEILNKEALIVLRNRILIYGSLIDQKVSNYEMVVEESKQLKMQLDSLVKMK